MAGYELFPNCPQEQTAFWFPYSARPIKNLTADTQQRINHIS
jgi:hypothetical protein